MITPNQKLNRTPNDFWSYCNHNLTCSCYWNLTACVKAQLQGCCNKRKELEEAEKQ